MTTRIAQLETISETLLSMVERSNPLEAFSLGVVIMLVDDEIKRELDADQPRPEPYVVTRDAFRTDCEAVLEAAGNRPIAVTDTEGRVVMRVVRELDAL